MDINRYLLDAGFQLFKDIIGGIFLLACLALGIAIFLTGLVGVLDYLLGPVVQ